MTNSDNELSRLWQSQQVAQIDMKVLKRQWRSIRVKQHCYMLLDFCGLLAPLVFVYLLPKKLTAFDFVLIGIVTALVALWVVYFAWLRRFSLGFGNNNNSTLDYVELIKTQYKQNIKIARLNKGATFILPIIFGLLFLIAYLGEYLDPEILIRKFKVIAVIFVVFLPANWLWAKKRQSKFEKALANFDCNLNRVDHS